MTAPNAITDIQDAFVNKMVDTLNDLPNVLWIVSEEAPATLPGGTSITFPICARTKTESLSTTRSDGLL